MYGNIHIFSYCETVLVNYEPGEKGEVGETFKESIKCQVKSSAGINC